MTTKEQALIRYKALDRCFSDRQKKYFIEDLVKECSKALSEHYGTDKTVSKRQILYDINFMESEAGYNAKIESLSDERRKYYRYSDSNYTIY